MITLNNFPIVAKQTHLNFSWSTTDNTDTIFEGGTLSFDSVNLVSGAGEIPKGRTALSFDTENPIPWGDITPQIIKDIFPTPQDALQYSLGALYESDEHQYRLGSKIRPEELPPIE